MQTLEAAVTGRELLADRCALERQLQVAERHYVDARMLADQIRDEWRNLSAHATPRPELVLAARAKFQAVAARCRRLLVVIDDLEARLDV